MGTPQFNTKGPLLFSLQNPSGHCKRASVQHTPQFNIPRFFWCWIERCVELKAVLNWGVCWTEAFLCLTDGFWGWKRVALLYSIDLSVEISLNKYNIINIENRWDKLKIFFSNLSSFVKKVIFTRDLDAHGFLSFSRKVILIDFGWDLCHWLTFEPLSFT